MPKELEDCVLSLKSKGNSESEAYAICGSKTGWVRKENGGWRNKKTGEIYESFLEMFIESEDNPFKGIKKGALHRWCKIPEDEDITCECIKKALDAGGHAAKMANWAKNFGKVKCK